MSYYVVKANGCLNFFYRADNGGLMLRTLSRGVLSAEVCLLQKIRNNFSVTMDNKVLYVFCQDEAGDVWLLTERDGRWNNRIVLKNTESTIHDVLITPMLSSKGLHIIYNNVSAELPGHFLVMRHTLEGGGWSAETQIDRFQAMGHVLYEPQATSKEHMLLFYQTRTAENVLGYREITPKRFGPYHRFHNTSGNITDTAYLTTEKAVHVLYIVRTLFSCQLLYRRRMDAHFDAPILLWEAPRIEHCLLSFVEGRLYATCMAGGQLNLSVSDTMGSTFSKIALYKSKFCYDPVKAVFLTDEAQDEQTMYVRQVYVDRNAPWDTQMIPDLYPAFSESREQQVPVIEKEIPVPSDTTRELQEQLTAARRSIDEKDRKIMQLMYEIKAKSVKDWHA